MYRLTTMCVHMMFSKAAGDPLACFMLVFVLLSMQRQLTVCSPDTVQHCNRGLKHFNSICAMFSLSPLRQRRSTSQ
ncbi:hypothetical protein V8C86DRAFT_2939168 [Haematococcus lacustris]